VDDLNGDMDDDAVDDDDVAHDDLAEARARTDWMGEGVSAESPN
jgi:hypothetical protein